ncbi:uncharacterized protein LOC141939850 [Strix uralensis]|uniref:uncharacterized protein LOC141939850 n=1 Tax=Strix uralensis TaxID=36305 RepID=UPI003DA6EE83
MAAPRLPAWCGTVCGGMRKKEKRCRRRAKAQMQKPSAERSRPQAPCKQPTPHGRPEQTPSWAASPPTKRGMKEPAPTLETCAIAKAPSTGDLWQRLPRRMYSSSPPLMSSSVSLDSFFCDLPRQRLYQPHWIHSSTSGSISSGDSCFCIPECRIAAMEELVAQESSGHTQYPEDNQGLVATAGGDGTLPKERLQPPTCMEVEAKLLRPGAKMWLNGQRVELPRGLLDTDEAVDGDKISRNNMAPDRSARLWRCLKACWNGAYSPAAAAGSASPRGDNAVPRGATGTLETADGGVGLGTRQG